MKTLEIDYSPITYKFTIKSDFDWVNTSFENLINLQKEKDERIFNWTEDAFKKFADSINERTFKVVIKCDEFEKQEICRQIEQLKNQEESEKIEIEAEFKIVDIEKIHNSILNFIKLLKFTENDLIKNSFKDLEERIEEIQKQRVNIVATATVSSGKSTVLNALMGQTLLPAKNEPTTATLCEIKINNKIQNFNGKITVIEEKTSEKIVKFQDKNIDEHWISKYSEEVDSYPSLEFFLEGPIKNFDTHGLEVFFVDTPGPNNSSNPLHKDITFSYLKDEKNKPILMLILNANQLRITDEFNIIKEIGDLFKKHKNSNDRILFILNKIDDLDQEKEPLKYIIDKTKNHLKEIFEIKNPKIFPVSAEFGRLLENESKNIKLNIAEKNRLIKYKSDFKPVPEDNYLGIPTFEHLPVSNEFKTKIKNELGKSEILDNMIYSGIYGLKKYLEYYIKHQHQNEVLHELYKILSGLINEINSKIIVQLISQKEEEKNQFEEFKKVETEKIIKTLNELNQELGSVSLNLKFTNRIETEMNRKVNNLQSKFKLKDSYKIEKLEAHKIGNLIEKDLYNLISSIKTSFESEVEASLNEYLNDSKILAKKRFSNLNENNHFVDLLHYKLDLKITSWDLNHIIKKNKKEEKIKIDDGKRWYNPLSWFTDWFAEYENEESISSDVFLNEVVDPSIKEVRTALRDSKDQIIMKSKTISEEFKKLIHEQVESSLKSIEENYIKDINMTEKDFELKKIDLEEIKKKLNSDFKKIL